MKLQSIALFISLSSFAITTISAQNSSKSDTIKVTKNKEMKTLVGTQFKIKQWGVSIAPLAQFGQMVNQNGLIAQLHFNNTWGIGVNMMGSYRRRENFMNTEDLRQQFGGLFVEYTPKANNLLHVSFPLTIGMIRQEQPLLGSDPLNSQYPHDHYDDHDRFNKSFGLQPGINLELNLFKYAKLFGGVNYRFAFGKHANDDIQGVSGQFGFKFGVFNKAVKK